MHKHIEEVYGRLHVLPDRLSVEEAAQLSAQLPMLVRGIYFEGWDPTRTRVKMHRYEFLERIRTEIPDPIAVCPRR